jgi:arginine/lysine/ornithine decarboxylase
VATAGGAAAAALLRAPLPEAALSPRDAFFAPTEAVPFAQAAGRICAELLCPYPPGVPVAYPGERLTADALAAVAEVAAAGGRVAGCADSTLRTLRVVRTLCSER